MRGDIGGTTQALGLTIKRFGKSSDCQVEGELGCDGRQCNSECCCPCLLRGLRETRRALEVQWYAESEHLGGMEVRRAGARRNPVGSVRGGQPLGRVQPFVAWSAQRRHWSRSRCDSRVHEGFVYCIFECSWCRCAHCASNCHWIVSSRRRLSQAVEQAGEESARGEDDAGKKGITVPSVTTDLKESRRPARDDDEGYQLLGLLQVAGLMAPHPSSALLGPSW